MLLLSKDLAVYLFLKFHLERLGHQLDKEQLATVYTAFLDMADKDFQLRIITPDRVFYEGTVDMVEFNTTEGQIGVLPGHIPLTVIVKPGILHITEKDGEKEAALHRAEERLRSKTPETDIARAETALQRAMARIQVLR